MDSRRCFADDPMGEDYDAIGETQGADDSLDDLGEVLRDAKKDCGKVKRQRRLIVC